jgi:lysozyme family protein
MSQNNFATSLNLTLVYEGGWVNNPKDPGGATYRGVTQAVYDDYRASLGQARQSVRLMSDAELQTIYRTRYWSRVCGDQLPLGLDYAVFDFAVNSGVARAASTLQGLVAAAADGNIGPKTLQAVAMHCATYGVTALTDGVCNARMNFLRMLPTYGEFGLGWQRRVMGALPGHQAGDTGVIDRAYDMAAGNVVAIPTTPLTTVKTYNANQLGAAA